MAAAVAFGKCGKFDWCCNQRSQWPANPGRKSGSLTSLQWSFTTYTSDTWRLYTPAAAGIYTVTTSHYGYQKAVVTKVEVVKDATTTRDFALTPAPMYVVDGIVTDSQTGWPLYAAIEIEGYPGDAVWTDPHDGPLSCRSWPATWSSPSM